MKLVEFFKQLNLTRILFFGSVVLILLLLFKSPFSERNLISNLEPYPDAIDYLSPALNIVQGKGFFLEREGRKKVPNVPFLYSATLIPMLLINNDVRAFYFANILISLLSLFLLIKICRKFFNNIYIIGSILFLYITNYFIYWLPNLAMAENLLIPFFLLSLLLLAEKPTPLKAILTGFLVLSFYATKYANIPLSASLFILYMLKISSTKEKSVKMIKLITLFVLSTSLAFLAFFLFEYITKGVNIISVVSYFLPSNYISSEALAVKEDKFHRPWFAFYYFPDHFMIYFKALIGQPIKFLWNNIPIVPGIASVLGLLGITAGLFNKQFRFISLSLLVFLFSQILFISTFYSVDGRYIYYAIPLILLGFGVFLSIFKKILTRKFFNYANIIFYFCLTLILLFYLSITIARVKYQIALNLKHAETPWYYVSVKVANSYFDTLSKHSPNKNILISALPPYFVDYFSGNRYRLLPLSPRQEFFKEKKLVWGIENDTDLIKLYNKYINEDYAVYISNYGLGDVVFLQNDYAKIAKNFNLIKVYEGCFNACNIYRLELENPKR